MYELERFFKNIVQSFIDWFTVFFTKVAIYLLIGVIAVIVLIVFVLFIKTFLNRNRYMANGRAQDKKD